MTIRNNALATLALAGAFLASVPALAFSPNNGDPRIRGGEVVQDSYSGSEDSMTLVTPPSSSIDDSTVLMHKERGNLNK